MPIRIYLSESLVGNPILYYTLQLIAFNKGFSFLFIDNVNEADIIIDDNSNSSISLCLPFYQYLCIQDFNAVNRLAQGSYYFIASNGRKDYLASIFYLVNCLQEYNSNSKDKYERYSYSGSFQKKEETLQINLVQELIEKFWNSHSILPKNSLQSRKSSFFLTHDIDTIYGSKNQNGDYALKSNKWGKIPRLLWNHYIGKPDWLNMNEIMALEESYKFKSTFYWLVRNDKKNADYNIHEPIIRNQLNAIKARGFEIGLHKSMQQATFSQELNELGEEVVGQRYHFLKFTIPEAWQAIEQSGLKLDSSLGFSEDYGFRNSYGLPFMPFNLVTNKVYDFIEVPMQIMDRTFFNQHKPIVQIEKELIDWLDKNKYNTVITINFHNNFFDKLLYAGYEQAYETILKYFKEEGLLPMLQTDLIREFYQPQLFNKSTA